jgi:hypothetical protein
MFLKSFVTWDCSSCSLGCSGFLTLSFYCAYMIFGLLLHSIEFDLLLRSLLELLYLGYDRGARRVFGASE